MEVAEAHVATRHLFAAMVALTLRPPLAMLLLACAMGMLHTVSAMQVFSIRSTQPSYKAPSPPSPATSAPAAM